MRKTLVELTHDGDVVAITEDAQGVWLDGNRIDAGGRAVTCFPDGTWVVGGLLPDGADRVVMRDVSGSESEATCNRGAWLAIPGDRNSVVRFETADGRVVAAPPGALGPEPTAWVAVEDAVTPCPACDTIAWAAADDVVRCTRCGHWVHGWVGYADGTGPPDHEPVEPAEAAASEEWARRTSLRLALEDLSDATVFIVGDSTRQPRLGG